MDVCTCIHIMIVVFVHVRKYRWNVNICACLCACLYSTSLGVLTDRVYVRGEAEKAVSTNLKCMNAHALVHTAMSPQTLFRYSIFAPASMSFSIKAILFKRIAAMSAVSPFYQRECLTAVKYQAFAHKRT